MGASGRGRIRHGGRWARALAARACGCAAGLLLALATPAGATLLLYEPFDYEPGALAGRKATGVNLDGAYAGNVVPAGVELRVASPGLDYGKLIGAPTPSGNRLGQEVATAYATAKVAVGDDLLLTPGAIYFSALVTLNDAKSGNRIASIRFEDDTNFDEISFGESPVGMRAVRISATTLGTGGLLVSASAKGAFENGDTLFLVGRYQNSAEADGDVLELLGYDVRDADVLPARFDPGDPNAELSLRRDGVDVNLARVTSIRFQIRGESDNFVDELRVGTDYADVVPEPGAASMLGAGLAGLGLCAARRQRAKARRGSQRRTDVARPASQPGVAALRARANSPEDAWPASTRSSPRFTPFAAPTWCGCSRSACSRCCSRSRSR